MLLTIDKVICKRVERALFSPISFSLSAGQMLHITGLNGVGKTTLLRCLTSFSRPTSGAIKWDDQCIFDNDDYKKSMLFLGHKSTIKPSLTVFENLQWCASLRAKPCLKQLDLALQKVGLGGVQNSLAGTLSSGQKQRLTLAKLHMATSAKLWILDEPFISLDKEGLRLVEASMIAHLQKAGMIIFTSHQRLLKNYEFYSELELTTE